MPCPLHRRAPVLGISIIATIKLPIKTDCFLRTWEPAGCLRSGFPHIWFSLLDKYTAPYWMSHQRVSPHFIGLLCHYSHSTSCFSKVEAGSLTADKMLFPIKILFKKIPVSFNYQSVMILWNAQEANGIAQCPTVLRTSRTNCSPIPFPNHVILSSWLFESNQWIDTGTACPLWRRLLMQGDSVTRVL